MTTRVTNQPRAAGDWTLALTNQPRPQNLRVLPISPKKMKKNERPCAPASERRLKVARGNTPSQMSWPAIRAQASALRLLPLFAAFLQTSSDSDGRAVGSAVGPRIAVGIKTCAAYHDSRASAVLATWGSRVLPFADRSSGDRMLKAGRSLAAVYGSTPARGRQRRRRKTCLLDQPDDEAA